MNVRNINRRIMGKKVLTEKNKRRVLKEKERKKVLVIMSSVLEDKKRIMWLRTVAWRTLRITHGEGGYQGMKL